MINNKYNEKYTVEAIADHWHDSCIDDDGSDDKGGQYVRCQQLGDLLINDGGGI